MSPARKQCGASLASHSCTLFFHSNFYHAIDNSKLFPQINKHYRQPNYSSQKINGILLQLPRLKPFYFF